MTLLPAFAPTPDLAPVLSVEEALARVPHAYAPATVRGWHVARRAFQAWAAGVGISAALPLAPAVVAAFVDALAAEGRKPGSVRTYVAALDWGHRLLDLSAPGAHRDVRLALKSMARAAAQEGVRVKQAAPLRRAKIDSVLAEAGDDLAALRDRALLALSYDTLARASELAGLDTCDVEPGACTIWRSKTDQEGEGSVRFVAPGTWEAVAAWIKAAKLRPSDPLFRPLGPAAKGDRLGVRDVGRIVKRRAGDAYSAHSTRVGAAVEMREAGVPTGGIAQSGGWTSDAMPARYTRKAAAQESGAAILARKQGRA